MFQIYFFFCLETKTKIRNQKNTETIDTEKVPLVKLKILQLSKRKDRFRDEEQKTKGEEGD